MLEMGVNKMWNDAGGDADVDVWQGSACCTCSTLWVEKNRSFATV